MSNTGRHPNEKVVFKPSRKGNQLRAILRLLDQLESARTKRQKQMVTARIHAANEKFFERWDEDALILIHRALS